MSTFTPTSHVAIVRMKKCGKRFEIACYQNKVEAWRNNVEKDIDEVLQMHTVYTNVAKGQAAKTEDLVNCFGSEDQTEICKEILAKGELQVSEKERHCQLESNYRDIATMVANMCVNLETKRPYPVAIIEKSMKEVHFSVRPNKSTKQQALEAIHQLKDIMPLQWTQMKLRVVLPQGKAIRSRLEALASSVEMATIQGDTGTLEMVFLTDPGNFQQVDELVSKESRGCGQVEVISIKEIREDDELLE
ncbi:hypothetical protein HPB49_018602 [Dermacentor silvarum]|uniref:Uncharacterized protein n=1 Tax=Dermacentor silvarum TaxID=543639 RepID=A0ACB8D7D0_DERSI|nr:ribosome maturation protein SBDS isoform X4 [Dermacentor silvarum]KAH7960311.1 hypothetical protein HPB49_018602 [Dermacentor silvarum]